MAVPKKMHFDIKKRISKNILKGKGYWIALKTFSLVKFLTTGISKSLFVRQTQRNK